MRSKRRHLGSDLGSLISILVVHPGCLARRAAILRRSSSNPAAVRLRCLYRHPRRTNHFDRDPVAVRSGYALDRRREPASHSALADAKILRSLTDRHVRVVGESLRDHGDRGELALDSIETLEHKKEHHRVLRRHSAILWPRRTLRAKGLS